MASGKRSLSRREALSALGALALSSHATFGGEGETTTAPPKAQPRIALQMYTVRGPAKEDLAGTLKKIRDMGWEYVQWGGGMPVLPAEKIREALDKAGLKASSVHTPMEPFEKDFEASVRFWKTVGATDIAPGSMMGDCKKTLADWLRGAKRLDVLGAKFRDVGMRLSYHNHYTEFEKFPGDPRRRIDILLEATKPENLKAEFDVAWVLEGGADPAAYLRKYKGRCPLLHVKDIVPTKGDKKYQFKPLGQGEVNWKEVFAAGREAGVEWYIYEQDGGEGSPFDFIQTSYEFLKRNVL